MLARAACAVVQSFHTTAEAYAIRHLRPLELPGVAEIQPGLGLLGLPAVDDCLAEQAMLVADAVTMGGQAQSRHALHETGGQTP